MKDLVIGLIGVGFVMGMLFMTMLFIAGLELEEIMEKKDDKE
jgi:hypothetical protein